MGTDVAMVVRSLTESFIFMRNNAFQTRKLFSSEKKEDRDVLISDNQRSHLEHVSLDTDGLEWQSSINSIQCTFSMIRRKIKEIIALHDHNLLVSDLHDGASDDQEIEHQTKELTQLFNLSHRQLNSLTSWRYSSNQNDFQRDKLAKNVISSLAGTLQDLSMAFRKAQSDYLNKLRSRDERIRGYLSSNLGDDELGLRNDEDDTSYPLSDLQKLSKTSLIEENTNVVAQREHEINEIVRSIHELNDIFRDVAQLVVDQGTLVDRIDNNVELTQARVQQGLKEITKTHNYQAKNRKMIVIMILASLVAILGILLIVTKFR